MSVLLDDRVVIGPGFFEAMGELLYGLNALESQTRNPATAAQTPPTIQTILFMLLSPLTDFTFNMDAWMQGSLRRFLGWADRGKRGGAKDAEDRGGRLRGWTGFGLDGRLG